MTSQQWARPTLGAAARTVACACAVAGVSFVGATAAPAQAAVPPQIRNYDVATIRSPRSADRDGRTRISIRALGRSFELDLAPSPIHAPGATTVIVDDAGAHSQAAQNNLYRGYLADDPEATVRVALTASSLIGSVSQDGETWYFEPLRRYQPSAAANETIVYRASDIDASALPPTTCGTGDLPPAAAPGAPVGGAPRSASPRVHGSDLGLLDLTVVADYEFFLEHGVDSADYIGAIIDQVDAFYTPDIAVTLEIVQTVIYTTPGSSPLSASSAPLALLESLADARAAQPALLGAGDLTHLFTGRELEGNVIGIAYVGTVCDAYSGSGLSQDFSADLHLMTLLAGHELGHNMGASHDGQGGSPCATTDFGYVMWPSISSPLAEEFSACSRETIEPFVAAAACITSAIPPGCGNGAPDPGEECDDGANESGDCCRADCRYDLAGARCDDDANQCTDNLCDGAGTCEHPANTDDCDDANACTLDGQCAAGSCVPSTDLRTLDGPKLKATFGTASDDDGLTLNASLVEYTLGSLPTSAGATVRLLDGSAGLLHESTIPAGLWTDASGLGKNFRYKAVGAPTAEADGLVTLQFKYRVSSGVMKIKGKYDDADLSALEGRTSIGIEVTFGDPVAGSCGTAATVACTAGVGRLVCR